MKKSKVIIPAMAMILFSTAASISGTVAWFTASRVFSMTAGDFKIAQLEGNLEATLTKGIGTMLGEGKSIIVGEGATASATTADTTKPHYLVDASFDHSSGKIFKQNRDNTSAYDAYAAYGSATDDAYTSSNTTGWIYKSVAGTGTAVTKYYLAVSWKITFKYNFSDNEKTKNIGIYLDLSSSKFDLAESNTAADGSGTDTSKNAKRGFRIAFVSTPRTVVWGDLADTSSYDTKVENNTYRYIKEVSSAGTETKYNNPNGDGSGTQAEILTHAYPTNGTYALAEDSVDANKYRADRITTIAKPTGTNTSSEITVTCVAWFEGCDLNITNGTALQTVAATMKFYSRIDA